MNPFSFPSKSTIDVEKAIKNRNDLALIVSNDLFSTKAKHANSVFSPASINSALTLAASGPNGSSLSSEILSFLRSSSTDEINAVFSKIVSVVFADHKANGGPKISSLNGVWIEQTLPIDSSFKDLFENVFKVVFDTATPWLAKTRGALDADMSMVGRIGWSSTGKTSTTCALSEALTGENAPTVSVLLKMLLNPEF